MSGLSCNSSSVFTFLDHPIRFASCRYSPRRVPVICVAIWATLLSAQGSAQQPYPNRPIRLIVGSAAGGGPDISARLIAAELSKQMGQQVVVDNRPGASNIIGFELIARAAPDGYTFGNAPFQFISNSFTFAKLPYDNIRDFQPVIRTNATPNLLTVSMSLPVRTVKELIEHARSNPGKLSAGNTGGGSSTRLSLELFNSMARVQVVSVPYKGIQQAITDAIGGQVQVVFDNIQSILPHTKAGKLRPLGITTLTRSLTAPEIPTIAEAGLPGYEMVPTAGYVLPAGVPRDIVLRLNAEINKLLKKPEIVEKFTAMGTIPVGGTPEQFAEHVRMETERWTKVARAAGIKPE